MKNLEFLEGDTLHIRIIKTKKTMKFHFGNCEMEKRVFCGFVKPSSSVGLSGSRQIPAVTLCVRVQQAVAVLGYALHNLNFVFHQFLEGTNLDWKRLYLNLCSANI